LPEVKINQAKMNAFKDEYLDKETFERVANSIREWVDRKGYLRTQSSLTFVSRDLGWNKKYVSHVVNREYGIPFPHFLNGLRVNHLKDMLQESESARDLKISYLCRVAGFSTYGKFSFTIRRMYNMSPREFISVLAQGTMVPSFQK
jgi:AraC-like DNA-binding protein